MGRSQRAEEAIAMIDKDASKILRMSVGPHTDVKPGQYIPRADAQEPPKLSLENAEGEYIVVEIDLDAPFAMIPFLSPIQHWVQSGLRSTGSGSELAAESTRSTTDYGPPGPPPGAAPHRYVVLLYAQPSTYDVDKIAPPAGKKVGIPARVRWSLEEFEKKTGLGDIVAANYFLSN